MPGLRPDGLYDHTLPDGTTVPLALPPGMVGPGLSGDELMSAAQGMAPQTVGPQLPAKTNETYIQALERRGEENLARGLFSPDNVNAWTGERFAPEKPPPIKGATDEKTVVQEGLFGKAEAPAEPQDKPLPPGYVTGLLPEGADPDKMQRGPAPEDEPPSQVDEARELARSYLKGELSKRPGRARVIPEHDQKVSFTKQPGQELAPGAREDFAGSVLDPSQVEQSADRALSLRQEARDLRASQLGQETDALAQEAAKREAINRELETRRERILKADAELDKVEPRSAEEITQDRNFFVTAMAAVLAGLQGGLNRRGDQSNSVIAFMERQTAQQVSDERFKYERALQRRQTASGDYADAIRMHGTPEAAELSLKARYSALYEKLYDNYADKIGDEQIKLNAQQQAAALKGKRAELNQQLFELEHGKVLQESWRNVPAQTVGGGGTDPVAAAKKAAELAKALREIEGGEAKGGTKADVIVRDPVTGEQFTAPDAATAGKARAALAASQELKANVAKQKALMGAGANRLLPGGAEKRAFDDLVERNKLITKELFDLGAISEADVELVSPIAGSRVWHSDEQTMRRLDSAVQTVDQKVNSVKQQLYRGPVTGGKPALGQMPKSTKVVK